MFDNRRTYTNPSHRNHTATSCTFKAHTVPAHQRRTSRAGRSYALADDECFEARIAARHSTLGRRADNLIAFPITRLSCELLLFIFSVVFYLVRKYGFLKSCICTIAPKAMGRGSMVMRHDHPNSCTNTNIYMH